MGNIHSQEKKSEIALNTPKVHVKECVDIYIDDLKNKIQELQKKHQLPLTDGASTTSAVAENGNIDEEQSSDITTAMSAIEKISSEIEATATNEQMSNIKNLIHKFEKLSHKDAENNANNSELATQQDDGTLHVEKLEQYDELEQNSQQMQLKMNSNTELLVEKKSLIDGN